ncbi:hypothetical protein CTAYLR_004393 [Chrysophaeum taylorii]|uniref:Peptidase C1A papain C-terminal domain-containing protein n=1 Tax=Chrysophaeum taylorii TaxID=2483200 RepID=A0AAD7ULV4_9STRA|nr:hypothetical protein CTAYLR_004393 [Chrysophaeum taylorii]
MHCGGLVFVLGGAAAQFAVPESNGFALPKLTDWGSRGQLKDPEALKQPAVSTSLLKDLEEAVSWKAAVPSRFANVTLGDAQRQMGVLQDADNVYALPSREFTAEELANVPESFDWRESPIAAQCSSLSEIRDQSNCGSCWAFGSVEAMTDRRCVLSNASVSEHLSAQDVTSCDHLGDLGCSGGIPSTVYTYYELEGIVTGGNYGDTSGCYAYELPPCAHHANSTDYPTCSGEVRTPKCARACDDTQFKWDECKIKGGRSYSICDSNDGTTTDGATQCSVKMAAEIYQNGPITGMFFVHQDFLSYSSGVYSSSKLSPMLGGHAIKILGFGIEDDTPYWLVANSWNEEWGENGYFKILRGSNECQIEDPVINGGPVAGLLPRLS